MLKKEINKIITQIHNNIKNEKNNNIKYALQELERNENDTMKMCEAFKKILKMAHKEKLIIKQKKNLPQMKKNSQKSWQNISRAFFIQTQHQC